MNLLWLSCGYHLVYYNDKQSLSSIRRDFVSLYLKRSSIFISRLRLSLFNEIKDFFIEAQVLLF